MERSIGEHAADSSRPCWKGSNRGRISALEAVYEGYRVKPLLGESEAAQGVPEVVNLEGKAGFVIRNRCWRGPMGKYRLKRHN